MGEWGECLKKNFLKNAISITFTLFRLSPFLPEVTGDMYKENISQDKIIRTNPGLSKNSRVQALRLVYLKWFNDLKNQQYTIKPRLNSGLS